MVYFEEKVYFLKFEFFKNTFSYNRMLGRICDFAVRHFIIETLIHLYLCGSYNESVSWFELFPVSPKDRGLLFLSLHHHQWDSVST